jgi:hypothetical protein
VGVTSSVGIRGTRTLFRCRRETGGIFQEVELDSRDRPPEAYATPKERVLIEMRRSQSVETSEGVRSTES